MELFMFLIILRDRGLVASGLQPSRTRSTGFSLTVLPILRTLIGATVE
jgi:hypothetical protein